MQASPPERRRKSGLTTEGGAEAGLTGVPARERDLCDRRVGPFQQQPRACARRPATKLRGVRPVVALKARVKWYALSSATAASSARAMSRSRLASTNASTRLSFQGDSPPLAGRRAVRSCRAISASRTVDALSANRLSSLSSAPPPTQSRSSRRCRNGSRHPAFWSRVKSGSTPSSASAKIPAARVCGNEKALSRWGWSTKMSVANPAGTTLTVPASTAAMRPAPKSTRPLTAVLIWRITSSSTGGSLKSPAGWRMSSITIGARRASRFSRTNCP